MSNSPMKKILACLTKADLEYSLINDNDKIAVGVSGGKDSMLLLSALKKYQMYSFKKFSFIAVFLDLGFGNVNIKLLKDYCEKLGVNLYIDNSTEVNTILSQHKNSSGKLPCSICSRMKKAAINKTAHQLNCNKVAFAHHCDDAIETLLMNTIYGGRVATFAPKMFLENTALTFIRPFILVREKDIIATCKKENIPIIKSSCPNDKHTMRQEMKLMLQSLYQKYPTSYQNYRNMLSDKEHFDLWFDKEINPLIEDYLIKECVNNNDFIEYMNFSKKKKALYQKDEHLFLIYKLEELIATISYYQDNDQYIIHNLVTKNRAIKKSLLKSLLLYLESKISQKYNPCKLICLYNKKENLLFELGYKKIKDGYYEKEITNAYRYRLGANYEK